MYITVIVCTSNLNHMCIYTRIHAYVFTYVCTYVIACTTWLHTYHIICSGGETFKSVMTNFTLLVEQFHPSPLLCFALHSN